VDGSVECEKTTTTKNKKQNKLKEDYDIDCMDYGY